jgi:PhnB protein
VSDRKQTTKFAPQLFVKEVAPAVAFYEKAFDAKELRRFSNPDGSIHVAEMAIGDALFHLHEETSTNTYVVSPEKFNSTTVKIELFVDDPDTLMEKSLAAGAIEKSSIKDFEYGFRQGEIVDPFGHYWIIEKDLRDEQHR